ncbi:MAG: carbohydrate ABC transporter permease, partial [Anaerolineales bacterium]
MAEQTMPSAAPTEIGKREERKQLLKNSRTAWMYILPAGILMLIISFWPQIYQIGMSFTDYRITNLRFNLFRPETWEKYAPAFVGLENYIKVLTSNLAIENYNFVRLLVFNIVWTFSNIIFHVSLGVIIALALDSKNLIGRKVYRVLFVLP